MRASKVSLVVTALILLLAGIAQTQPCFAVPGEAVASAGNGSGTSVRSPDEVHVKIRMLANVKSISPGKPFRLGVELVMDPDWHTYYKESGDAGMPTKIEWKLPPGFTAGSLKWEKPERFDEGGIVTYGYKTKTFIAAEITPPANVSGDKLNFSAHVKWLSCKEICLPGEGDTSLSLAISPANAEAQPDNADLFAAANFDGPVASIYPPGKSPTPNTEPSAQKSGTRVTNDASKSVLNDKYDLGTDSSENLLTALGLALAGGLVLNLMPCVLPVIAIKLIGLLEQAHDEPARVRSLGLSFSAGIISSFIALAALVLGIQAAGNQVGWGFQFQYPGFVIAMSVVVLLLALSLFGFFYIQVGAGDNLNKLADKEGMVGTFFKGVLATVLSTPCTAPFLGPALGFGLTQPWYGVLLIFGAVGVGMSLPYLVLCAKPEWLKFMPKPGDWMEKLKESFGFILLATNVWLLWVLGSQVGLEGAMWTTAFLVAIAFAAWLLSRFTDLTSTAERKLKVRALAGAIVLVSFYYFIAIRPGIGFLAPAIGSTLQPNASGNIAYSAAENGGIAWEPLDLAKLKQYKESGKTVLLDFTAQWCLTCKLNEQSALVSPDVVAKIKALNVVPIRADWTSSDPDITAMLHQFGRSGVPFYVVLPGSNPSKAIRLPDGIITANQVIQALDQAGPSK